MKGPLVLIGAAVLGSALFSLAARGAMPCATLASPDGQLELGFETGPNGMFWSLSRKGKTIVAPSRLGLV